MGKHPTGKIGIKDIMGQKSTKKEKMEKKCPKSENVYIHT
jgi:hypothetical protein